MDYGRRISERPLLVELRPLTIGWQGLREGSHGTSRQAAPTCRSGRYCNRICLNYAVTPSGTGYRARVSVGGLLEVAVAGVGLALIETVDRDIFQAAVLVE
jgi:hypothetical protein